MKAIDKIIFNELASRRAVALPGLGTLGVIRRTAQVEGKEVKAPVNEVVFSKKEAEDAPSVIALMESMGLNGDAARAAYKEWLDVVCEGGSIVISGVGKVEGDAFTPSAELSQMLNPVRTKQPDRPVPAAAAVPISAPAAQTPPPPAENKKSRNCLTNILLIIAIILLLAVACFCVARKGCTFCKDGRELRDADAGYNTAPGRVKIEQAVPVLPQEVTPAQPQTQTQPAQITSDKYHVIAGSFVYESNADQLIARYRREFPDLKVEKLMTTAWVMVSVWQGATAEEGAESNSKLQDRLGNHGMWVYRER